MNNEIEPTSPSSLKQKLKSSLCLPWLHHPSYQYQRVITLNAASTTPLNPTPMANKQRLSRTSSSTWIKSPTPEFKDKCRNLINRIGHGPCHRHSHSDGHGNRRRHTMDFRYDPSSYALNFDEGCDDSQLDAFPFRNFTARLPPSPTSTTSGEITVYTRNQKSLVL